MKLQTAKAGLWLVALAMSGTMCGTTVAAAQISSAQAFSPMPRYSIPRDAVPALATTESSLPDAPSAVAARQPEEEPVAKHESPRAAASNSIGPTFLVANGLLLGSTIANAAAIGNCRPSACQSVPDAIRSRGTLYAIGIPASLGVSYISYRLKRGGTKWWIAPVALFTAGNVIYAAHAARLSNP
jgi:hypothetical protein